MASQVAGSRLAIAFALTGGLALIGFTLAILLEPTAQYVILALSLAASIGALAIGVLGLARGSASRCPHVVSAQVSIPDLVIDAATTAAQRRWSEPWLRPFPTDPVGRPRAVLLPGAAYHLAEIAPLADELERRGYEPIVCVGEAHWSRTQPGLLWFSRPTYAVPSHEQLEGIAVVVTMKDWASYQATVEAAKALGILTVAIVEGAQDFDDLHQPVEHRPYRTADLVLCQGDNDADALRGRPVAVVGSNRLEQLSRAPAAHPNHRLALINVNFTYGVLTDERDRWVQSGVDACTSIGLPYVLSIHPAAKAHRGWSNTTRLPISLLLPHVTVLVSRFSTVPFEAMARGVPFVYHNPHAERMPTFQQPSGAFDVTSSSEELAVALQALDHSEHSRARTDAFFAAQVSIVDGAVPAQRAADAIEAHLGR